MNESLVFYPIILEAVCHMNEHFLKHKYFIIILNIYVFDMKQNPMTLCLLYQTALVRQMV